jgi:hypothetical protein
VGVWLRGSYKQPPTGVALAFTHALIALALVSAALGALYLLRRRRLALAGWIALMLIAWLAVASGTTTWVTGKEEMLTSPVVVLLAWSGIAALRGASGARLGRWTAAVVALALAGGVLASDFAQYRGANLAPTARYEELASLNDRFAGRGPALLTDFDEYALYELRDLDVAGPDFVLAPSELAALAGGHGQPVQLDRASPGSLRGYPLIITRRDPTSAPPPAAYRLAWQGHYYEVWSRDPVAPVALAHVALSGAPAARCAEVARLARLAGLGRAQRGVLIAARSPELVGVSLEGSTHPAGWGHQRQGLVMSRPGRLSADFSVPRAGAWDVWLQGQIMPPVSVGIDGRAPASVSGALDGNSLVPDTIRALTLRLAAGAHHLVLTRGGFSLAPGSAGSAVLDAIFLTPAGLPPRSLRQVPLASWRGLCGGRYQWLEALS